MLKNYPAQFIYEPWMASPMAQKQAKCIIGQDYPMCIVDHNIIHKKNIEKMKMAYESSKNSVTDDTEDPIQKVKPTTSAQPIAKGIKNKESSKSASSSASGGGKSGSITDFFKTKTSPDTQPPSKKAKK